MPVAVLITVPPSRRLGTFVTAEFQSLLAITKGTIVLNTLLLGRRDVRNSVRITAERFDGTRVTPWRLIAWSDYPCGPDIIGWNDERDPEPDLIFVAQPNWRMRVVLSVPREMEIGYTLSTD